MSVFQKKNWVCLFPTILAHFCPKFSLFCQKSRVLVGNRQTKFFFQKCKVSTQEMSLDTSSATKAPKVMILCFSKVRSWSCQILKNEKFSDFFTFSKEFLWKKLNFSFFKIWHDHDLTLEKHKIMTFGAFVALEVSKDISWVETLHFWKKKLVCLFPTKTRDFWQKMLNFGQKCAKIVGNRQTQNFFWKTDKVNTFFSPKFFSAISDQ